MLNERWVACGGTAVRITADAWLDEPSADPLVRGLARNPAAPAEVLLRLLDTHEPDAAGGLPLHPDPPPAVVAAMLAHPGSHQRRRPRKVARPARDGRPARRRHRAPCGQRPRSAATISATAPLAPAVPRSVPSRSTTR